MYQRFEQPDPMPTAAGAAIAAMIDALHAADAPGGVVLAARDGALIYRGAFGYANIELGVRNDPSMRYRLASVSKQFTAVAIMLLVEQGRIALDDDLATLLPDYPVLPHRVTLEHLLTHTSGITSYTDMPSWMPTIRNDLTLEELIAVFKDEPLLFAPGERWAYNNSAFVLLGAIIERVSGQTYEQFMHDHIFAPLGMQHTTYDHSERIVPGRAAGYQRGADGIENAPYMSMTQPHAAGALLSTVDDLLVWDEALYTDRLVSRPLLDHAHTPYRLSDGSDTGYGYGWAVFDYDGDHVVGHPGGIIGFNTFALRVPHEHVFVAVLLNSTVGEPTANLLAMRVARLALGKSVVDPDTISMDAAVLDEYVGAYRGRDDAHATLRRVDEHLVLEQGEGDSTDLWASAHDYFFVRDRFTRIAFTRDDGGAITGYLVNDMRPSMHMARSRET